MNIQVLQKIKTLPKPVQEHSQRTAFYAVTLSSAMGLDPDLTQDIYLAGLFHDYGKSRIPASILEKPGKLSSEEWTLIKTHPDIGADLLKDQLDEPVLALIRYHHERPDGEGYHRLCGRETPLGARILHVCDVYDALTTTRSYKEAWSQEKALQHLKDHTGTDFDPECVRVFCSVINV